MKALVFDLGDTLIEYEGLPLSWEAYYPAALLHLSEYCQHHSTEEAVVNACQVLRRHNTRLYPRTEEISYKQIATELCATLGCKLPESELGTAQAFFSLFRQRLRCFPDSLPCLLKAKSAHRKVGIFTDVPYGMPKELVVDDLRDAGLEDFISALGTSVEAGFRKPHPRSLGFVLDRMGVSPATALYVGNERKDVEVALALGCESILVDRRGFCPDWGQHRTVSSLLDI
jgi:putative hydrolase of the HAD superfamily